MGNKSKIINEPVDAVMRAVHKGLDTNMHRDATLDVAGTSYTKAEILDELERRIELYDSADAARKAYGARVDERDKAEPATAAFVRDLGHAMASKFGSSPQVMDRFGFPNPKPRRELTPQELVVRSAKAQATRKLRGTRSSKQRAAIKAQGDFTLTVGAQQPAPQPATREEKNVVVEKVGDLGTPALGGPTMAVNSAGKV